MRRRGTVERTGAYRFGTNGTGRIMLILAQTNGLCSASSFGRRIGYDPLSGEALATPWQC